MTSPTPELWIDLDNNIYSMQVNQKMKLVAECDSAETAEFIVSTIHDLLDALESLFEHCAMIHKLWGSESNNKQADDAIAAARAAISKAKGI
jgi:hypothetical protein